MDLKKFIATVPDFRLKDSLSRHHALDGGRRTFRKACEELKNFAVERSKINRRPRIQGFIFGCPIAYALNIGCPVRKPGKLPRGDDFCFLQFGIRK